MSFTYNVELADDVSQVRFMIQDKDCTRQLFQDEEITWVLSTEDNIYAAAAQLCEQLVIRSGNVRKKVIGDLSITYDVAFYRQLAGQFRARGAGNQVPYAGGISITDKERQQGNADGTPPSIFRNIDENPAAPQPSIAPINPLETI